MYVHYTHIYIYTHTCFSMVKKVSDRDTLALPSPHGGSHGSRFDGGDSDPRFEGLSLWSRRRDSLEKNLGLGWFG